MTKRLGAVLTLAMPAACVASPSKTTSVSSSAPAARTAAMGTTSPTAPGTVRAGAPATVAVSVAVVWGSPTSPRAVDARALENPRIRTWLAGTTTAQRRALGPTRINSSVVLGFTSSWAREYSGARRVL